MSVKPTSVKQVPGVDYDPTEHRARIHGTGIEPWLVALSYENAEGDWSTVRAAFDWLSEEQLRAAIAFWNANPEMIRQRIDQERSLDMEAFWRKYPQTRPSRR